MDPSVLFGGSLLAAFVAGLIALLAPCCISVMLPAYFASTFQNRRMLVAMTLLFGAGVATVILPIVMGASFLVGLITDHHSIIYITGGVLLLALAIFVLTGGELRLPMPGRRANTNAGPFSIYSLGVFSGVASSCCAPVLAGVIALSSFASSFGLVLLLGISYVIGMVAPLLVITLLWERYDWGASRLFKPRTIRLKIGNFQWTLSGTAISTGLLLGIMGIAAVWIGITQDSMPSADGWASEFSLLLQRYGRVVTDNLSWIPNWFFIAVIVLFLGLAIFRSIKKLCIEESSIHKNNDK